MAVWIPGPQQYCWPAKAQTAIKGESPHSDAIAEAAPKPARRRSPKSEG